MLCYMGVIDVGTMQLLLSLPRYDVTIDKNVDAFYIYRAVGFTAVTVFT